MSAIAGIWHFDGNPDAEADCARMLRAQEIYGPHDGRVRSEGALALGRRLFKILPEDAYDRQPLQSRDGRLTLVADVRLDNRGELRPALALSADGMAKLCDAEILLSCLERWGEGALERIVGDFAFALWNARDQTLLLGRDHMGRRPLHFHRGRGFFAFASMAKGLHALPDVPYAPDEATVAEFIGLMPQAGVQSFFKHISRVESAHVVRVTRGQVSPRRYWSFQRLAAARMSTDDYVEGLRHHLDQAVQARLRGAKQAVASQLSAGFDSAAVTATAARLMAAEHKRVFAFTAVPRAGYSGKAPRNRFNDEGPLAAATAAMYPNIDHILIRSEGRDPLQALDRQFFLFEQPVFTAANAAWAHAIYDAARERDQSVLLTATGGNMTISYHGLELLPELLCRGRLLSLLRTIVKLRKNTSMRWRGALAKTFGPFMPVSPWQWLNNRFTGSAWDALDYTAIRPDRLAELDEIARSRNLDFAYRPWSNGFAMRAWVMQRGDPGNGIKGVLGGWGLDLRDPTADKRLIEFCLSVPMEEYLRDGVPRALAKRALADRVPAAVLNEQKKGYQAADWHERLTAARSEAAAEIARIETCPAAARLLDVDKMKRLVENWPTGGWETDTVIRPYRLALLRGISAGHFLRKASGANR